MPAIRHDPKADIQLIRGILRAGYEDGFPVLKELLQNSDDAGAGRPGATASTFSIVLVPNGLSGSSHSLLKEPGICILNDGEFRESDAECLPTLGLSNKAADATSIGKFGTGLKTVFYLGEAFFYFCNKENDWSEKARACDLVSPWGEYRQEWEDEWLRSRLEEHARLREFASCCGMAARVFGVWIPLRRQDSSRGWEFIHHNFPAGSIQPDGLAGIFGKGWTSRLAEFFGLQRNLRVVKVGSFCSERQFVPEVQLSFHPDSRFLQVTTRDGYEGQGWTNEFGGVVEAQDRQNGRGQTHFRGIEVMGVGELHSKFRAADNWPRQAAAGQTTDEKERATPHAAVVFTKSSASGSGRLHVQSAVFLPLGNAEVVGCQGKWDFSLICHAFFFVDSSRRHIESFDIQKDRRFPGEDGPMTEAELRRAWNCSLFTQLVCPQVLPAFAQFVGRTDLTFEEIELLVESLSAAFKDSSLFQKCQEWLFARHGFFYQIGETACLWRLGEAGVPIYAIPDWKGDINGLFTALPGLKTVIRDTSVTFSGKPILADGKPEQIPDKSLAAVISGGCANVYGRSGILPYVLRLLPANLANREPQSALVRAVIGLCRLALTTPDAAKPEDRDERLRLFSRLPPRAIIQLPFESKEVGLKLASALAEEELPVALLWKDWTDKLDASGKLSWDSIKPLLVRLANYVPEDVREVQQRSAICVRLLESASDLPSNWRDQIRDLALFEVELVGFGLTSASISELRQFLTNRSLFCGGKELAGCLRAAAPGLQLAHISVGLNKVLELGATACSAEACVALLSGASALAKAFADRKHLFDRILNQAISEKGARAKALRCLLHGTPEQWGNVEDDLFEAASGNIDPLFAGLIRQALQQLNQLWRMIPESIASQLALTDAQRQDLRLVQPSAPKAQALLRLVGPDKIDCAHLTLPECDVLQQQFDDVEVLRALNIFETTEGARVSITHSTYVDSGFTELPPKFSGLVTLLKRKPRYLLPIHGVVLAHELGWEAVIEIAFAQQNPADHWESIMLALSKGTPRKDLHEPILKTSWLPPAAQGAPPVAPGDLLHVEGLDDELEKLLVALQSPFRPLAAVKKEARTHAGFATLSRTVLPRPGECVRQLAATILQQDSDVKYSSGLVGDWSAENVSDWLLVFSEVAADTLPLASVVKALAGKPATAEYLPEFLQVTGRELTTAKCVLVLDFLAAQHKLATQEKKAFFERVTIRYLRQHAQSGTQGLLELLKQQSVKLLNASGQWKSPSELTFVTSNIHPGDRLSDSFAAALESLKPSRPEIRELAAASLRGGASETDTQVACILKQYFMPWRSLLLNRDPIGAFMCLTGDGPAVLTLAREFFTTSSVDSVRAWINQNDRSDLGTIEERIWRRRFEITTIKEDHAEVASVIGTTFRARLSSRPASLFIGTEDDGIEVIQEHGVTVLRLRLRELQFEREEFGADGLVELLRASTDHLLRALRARVDVGPLFQKLSIASQLHVRVAQNMVIEGAIAFLRQIGAQRHPPIKEALAKWDEARRHEAEDEVHGLNSSRSAKERREARDALRKLLATDEEAQRAVLEAVRRKISEFQYAETSVPFELWQNADDAVVELDRIGGDEKQAASLGFVVREFDGTLLFLHWGRPINEFQSTTGADYRGVGFDRDLEKMLVPAMSDKADAVQAGGHALTGKFGLGFKSVFLMSDKPRVVSGALDFQVCGGIYPIPLDESARQDLQEQLKRTAPASFRRGTVICLPVRKGAKVDPPHCLSPFLRLAPLLVVFSRRIKRLRLNLGTAPEQSFTWNPNSILPDGCDFGSIAGPLESPRSALVLTARDSGDAVSLLLGMGNHGFLPLPQGTPVFWVTSPTRERASYGFAINGAFEPDVGRVQIAANSQKNAEIAQSMSQALAARLGALWNLAKADWPAFRLRLDLTDIQPYEFWESLWEVCGARFAELCPASDETTVAQLAREILWPTQARGLRLFYSDCATLPTGLEGDYRVLTRLNQLRFIADGVLEDKTIFTRVAGWPQFRKRITPGSICSRGAVSRKLAALKLPCDEWEIIKLAGVVAWILCEAKLVDPEQAQQLGEVITLEFTGSLIKAGNRSEYDELVAGLRECKFLAEDGSWHAPGELLLAASLATPEPNSDEDLRAAFAPRQNRLNAAYAQAAISFFRTCRNRFDADAEKLVCWIWATERDETRVASLRYLLHPRAHFRTEVSERLRNRLTAEQTTGVRQSWLWKVESYEWWVTEFTEQERSEIVAHLLRLSELTAPPAPPPPPPPPPPDVVLENIYKWWTEEANRDALIRSYEMRLYPYGRRPHLDTDPERLRRDTSTRKQWLILWLLGAFHTIGRTRDQQHRNFLELCEEHGWLDVFSAAQSVFPEERSDEYLTVLDEYFSDHGQWLPFYHWFRQYVTIYKSSRWLHEDVELVLETDKSAERISLEHTFTARLVTGFDAPPSAQALGMGRHFILRELVRFGILHSPHIYEQCFVPVARVCRLMERIGCSGGIYASLCRYLGAEKATFNGSFDLPLLFVAENEALQRRFLSGPVPPPPEGTALIDEI